MRNKNVLNLRRSLPCMSWSPKNLYNLWKRTVGPKASDLAFKVTNEQTVFQQRWASKAAVRAYHGDFIPEKVFKRWYLPQTIPDVRPRRAVFAESAATGGGDRTDLEAFAQRKLLAKQRETALEAEIEAKGMAPVGSLMFAEVERRLDVFVFRCCFAHSVYEARRLIIHGYVRLNGRKHNKANTRLAPGDMVSVDPDAMRFFKPPHGPYDDVNAPDSVRKANPEPTEGAEPTAAATEGDAPTAPTTESTEPAATTTTTAESDSKTPAPVPAGPKSTAKHPLTPFYLPQYAAPWLHIPAYIEVSFRTCSAVYVRHPTARPGYSEIPTPYDADGALVRYAWEWYMQRRPRMRSASQLARAPEDRVLAVAQALHRDWTRGVDPGWGLQPHAETEAGRKALEARRAERKAQAAKMGKKGAGGRGWDVGKRGREAAPHLN